MRIAGLVCLIALFLPAPGGAQGAEIEVAGRTPIPSHPSPATPESRAVPLELPPGFPAPVAPADSPWSPERAELGRDLFYDRRLSGEGSIACSDCHRQELAFTDGRPRAVGATGEVHRRNTPSLVNVAYAPALTWADPRITSLEQQVLLPLLGRDPVEMGMAGREAEIFRRLRAEPRYRRLFTEAFPERQGRWDLASVTRALGSFVRTLVSSRSPWDRFVWRGDTEALSASARRGLRLFFSERLGCGGCHAGLDLGGPSRFAGGPPVEAAFHNTGLYNVDGRGSYPAEDPGLVEVTGRQQDAGRFRTPGLRNVVVTAPYMHDGSVPTLDAVIELYAAGGRRLVQGPNAGDGRASPRKHPRLLGFELTPEEHDDLLAFLASLTDHDLLSDPRFADPWAGDRGERSPARAPGREAPGATMPGR